MKVSKFNQKQAPKSRATSPIRGYRSPGITTHEGAPASKREPKSELFLLGVSDFYGEATFYESADDRRARLVNLVRQVAAEDAAWLIQFVRWLRREANIRTTALVIALEGAKALHDMPDTQFRKLRSHAREAGVLTKFGEGLIRALVGAPLARADEPGEAVAYWFGHYGRNLPFSVKKAIRDAAGAMYNEYTALKYDTASHEFRFADVLELTHPQGDLYLKNPLFTWLLDRRHGNKDSNTGCHLSMVARNAALRERAEADPTALLHPVALRDAGMTWEDVLSLVGSKVDKKRLWEAIIPSMGYMALLRNLRNFDQAGVRDEISGVPDPG